MRNRYHIPKKGFPTPMIRDWTLISKKLEKDYRIFQVWEKQARSPRTGNTLDVKAIHINPWAMILAITPEDEAVMVRQYRHGIEQVCLELPGGLLDPEDSSPAAAARRELQEETGYGVSDILDLGECFPQPAVLNNKGYFFLGTDAKQVTLCHPLMKGKTSTSSSCRLIRFRASLKKTKSPTVWLCWPFSFT